MALMAYLVAVVLEGELETGIEGEEEVHPRDEDDYAPPYSHPRSAPPRRVPRDVLYTEGLLESDLGD
jgi:hypothetical protein